MAATSTIDPDDLRCYVGGKAWHRDPVDELDAVNPADGSVVRTIPDVGADGADAAVRAAMEAFDVWRRKTPKERSEALFRLADIIETRADDFAVLESLDVGKPLMMARNEIVGSADKYRFFAGAGRSMRGVASTEFKPGITSLVRREPIGVVAALAPWNYPMALTAWKIAPALAAGNTVVLKPSPESAMSAMLLGEIAAEALPPGVLNIITGAAQTGSALVSHPQVGMVSLTGGTPTGRVVMAAAAQHVKVVHLELGGKAPVVVFDDADVERLVRALRVGSFWNGGQDCTCASRLYVTKHRHNEVVAALASMADSLTLGDPLGDPAPDMGPLVSTAHRDRVQGFVDRAVDTGHIEVVAGGETGLGRGAYLRPTIVAGCDQDDEIVQSELFGPVISIVTHENERQAIEFANGVDFGLAASVWSQDIDRALRVANEIQAGTVWINDHGPTAVEMPFGGYKQSGIGRDLSEFAIEEHTELKHIAITIRGA